MADWFYDGADLRVRTRLFPQSAQTVVTFTGRNARPPVEQGFGEAFFLKRRIPAIHFISKANHWWQTAEVDEAIARLRAAGLLDGPLVLYGSSMGGYAALRHSAALRPQRVVALSPQFSIDPRRVPFEARWQHYAARLDFRHDDMAAGLDRQAQVLVLVDPQFAADRRHVDLVQRIRPVELLPLAFAGHNTARALEEVGLVSTMLTELLAGTLQRPAAVRQWRSVRRQSALAWHGLAERLQARGHAGHAVLAATLAAGQLQASGRRMRDTALQVDIHAHAASLACADGHEALAQRSVQAFNQLCGNS